MSIAATPVSILFVCTGNICRSPTAEAVFRSRVEEQGLADRFVADSAGTHGYHIGDAPDPRAVATARGRGIDMRHLMARRFEAADFDRFDYIFAMDRGHRAFLERLAEREHKASLALFLDGGDKKDGLLDVPDPYYGGQAGFERVYDLIEARCTELLRVLCATHKLNY